MPRPDIGARFSPNRPLRAGARCRPALPIVVGYGGLSGTTGTPASEQTITFWNGAFPVHECEEAELMPSCHMRLRIGFSQPKGTVFSDLEPHRSRSTTCQAGVERGVLGHAVVWH